jgi:hypothetical protein
MEVINSRAPTENTRKPFCAIKKQTAKNTRLTNNYRKWHDLVEVDDGQVEQIMRSWNL